MTILNPFGQTARITSSSNQGHHTPYGGTVSLDADVDGSSPGTMVRYRGPVEAAVLSVRPACATGRIEDGGYAVEIQAGDVQLTYAHLDPTSVVPGQRLLPGSPLGYLGPDIGQAEYNSPCARGSHLHLEASSGTVPDLLTLMGKDEPFVQEDNPAQLDKDTALEWWVSEYMLGRSSHGGTRSMGPPEFISMENGTETWQIEFRRPKRERPR